MRKLFVFFLLVNFNSIAYNQVIKGTILDRNTGSPVYFASIYFNGTFTGTHSDNNGYFELEISNNISIPLSISALGYYSVTLDDFLTDETLLIYLVPKVFELQEVFISAKAFSRARRKNLILFKNAFFGETINASQCKIINEDDITFDQSENDTLKVYSLNPILIDNKALGYKVTYFLDEFELHKKDNSFFFTGNIIFEEDLINKTQKRRFERRRGKAYLGSRMHFCRALWRNSLDSEGFSVTDTLNVKLDYDRIVIQTDSITKYLRNNGKLFVAYYSKIPETRIVVKKENIYFDKNGYFNPYDIVWEGEMAKQRIADWLPYEYSIK